MGDKKIPERNSREFKSLPKACLRQNLKKQITNKYQIPNIKFQTVWILYFVIWNLSLLRTEDCGLGSGKRSHLQETFPELIYIQLINIY